MVSKWQQLLALEVQDPEKINFSAFDLHWNMVEGNVVAWIKSNRYKEFIIRESKSPLYPTSFRNSYNSKSQNENENVGNQKHRIDSTLEYIIFWCSYGPDDHQEIDKLPVDISKVPKHGKGSRPGRKHIRRGCLCHFSIRILKKAPERCLITYSERNHIDIDGKLCHGQETDDFVGTRAYHAPHISRKLYQWVERCFLFGMSTECVHQKHHELVHDKVSSFELEFDRNDFLSRDDIGNIERKLKHAQYMFHKNDSQSVHIWQAANPDKVFYYSEFDKTIDDEGHIPFILGIQQPLQLEWMRKYGHDSILAMDSTFGTNRFKFQLYTLLAFDSQHNGVPVAWVIMSRSTTSDIVRWMETLLLKVRMGMMEWKLNAFMVDDAAAEIGAIRKTFQCEVYLCNWHVRRAWLKHLVMKVKHDTTRRSMFKHLGDIMHNQTNGDYALEEANRFLNEFKKEDAFVEYFRARWLDRIGMWEKCCRTLKHAEQETNGAIESYHSHLKNVFLKSIRSASHRQVDWLVHQLVTVVHIFYWWRECGKENGFHRNYRVEKMEAQSWLRAQSIPDDNVTLHHSDPSIAYVQSQHDIEKRYMVWQSGPNFAMSDCSWENNGYLCKHVIKVTTMREKIRLEQEDLEIGIDETIPYQIAENDGFGVANGLDFPVMVDNNVNGSMITSNNVNPSHDQRRVSQRIRDIFESLMQLPSEESHLCFLEKHMEDIANEFKTALASTTLGLDHPAAPYFQQVQDGFGNTLQHGKDFLERMVTRKSFYTSSSSAHFPLPTQGTRRQTFDDVPYRAARRDSE